MKTLICALGCLLIGINLIHAQDRITLRNGSEEVVKITEVTPTQIKYRKYDNINGPIFTKNKSEIFMIVYENGDKDVFQNVVPSQNVSAEGYGYKSPGTAMLLSILIPGGGQYYNGDYIKGGIMTGAWVGGAVMMFSGAGYYYYGGSGLVTAGSLIVVGSYVWSVIDAPMGANKYNNSLGLLEYGREDLYVKIEPFNSPGLGGSVKLKF